MFLLWLIRDVLKPRSPFPSRPFPLFIYCLAIRSLAVLSPFFIVLSAPPPTIVRALHGGRRGNTGALLKSFLRRFVRLHGMIFSGKAEVTMDEEHSCCCCGESLL